MDKTRSVIHAKGYKCLRNLGTLFRKFDSYSVDRTIDRAEFYVGLRELGIVLSKVESDVGFGSQFKMFWLQIKLTFRCC